MDEKGMKNRLEAVFPARSENEGLARSVAAAFAAQVDPTIEELTEIRTAVSEAVSNAVIHAYPEEDGDVILRLELRDDGVLVIVIEDQGVGIDDVAQAREPLYTTGNSDERSGMGFTVMESFMDRVEVVSGPGEGTKVTMIKRLDLSYGY